MDGNSAGGAIYAGTTSVVKGKESLLVIESCKFIRNADKEGKVQDRGYEVYEAQQNRLSNFMPKCLI